MDGEDVRDAFATRYPDYEVLHPVGHGGHGLVFATRTRSTGRVFAVKYIPDVFDGAPDGRRALREIKVLRHLRGHENVIFLHEVLCSHANGFNHLFIVQEYMPTDLDKILETPQPLSEDHVQWLTYQLLRGLKFMHSANIIHRDLKPSNLLINATCDLKICDFGLARGLQAPASTSDGSARQMTEYVVTRWYRAPELMLAFDSYGAAVDMWSVGCILGEMLLRRPVFPGRDYLNQLKLIIAWCGSPPAELLRRIRAPTVVALLQALPKLNAVTLSSVLPDVSEPARHLLASLLEWDPHRRPSAAAALTLSFVATYRNPDDEPVCPLFDDSFEAALDVDDGILLRALIQREADLDEYRRRQLAQAPLVMDQILASEAVAASASASWAPPADAELAVAGGSSAAAAAAQPGVSSPQGSISARRGSAASSGVSMASWERFLGLSPPTRRSSGVSSASRRGRSEDMGSEPLAWVDDAMHHERVPSWQLDVGGGRSPAAWPTLDDADMVAPIVGGLDHATADRIAEVSRQLEAELNQFQP